MQAIRVVYTKRVSLQTKNSRATFSNLGAKGTAWGMGHGERSRRSEVRSKKSEGRRSLGTKNWALGTEERGRRSEVRDQRTEGSRQIAAGSSG